MQEQFKCFLKDGHELGCPDMLNLESYSNTLNFAQWWQGEAETGDGGAPHAGRVTRKGNGRRTQLVEGK
jgi:hypothetical protein